MRSATLRALASALRGALPPPPRARASSTLPSGVGGGGGGAPPAALALPPGSGTVYRATLDAERGVGVVVLNAPPVNALGTAVLGELAAALRAAAADGGVRALVLASASAPGVFSGGLDIAEMAGASEAGFARFWREVQGLFLTLWPLGKPVVAAVEGAAPAGGCWLALQADHRVLLDEPRAAFGLNEVALGIVAPPWFAAPLERAVGPRAAESMLQLATLLPPARALALGAVDELAPRGRVLGAAADAAARYGAVHAGARNATKQMLRAPLIAATLGSPAAREADLARTWKYFSSPEVQIGLRTYLDRLAKRAR
jgi:3,2-trans-enoyl-CoA isomerase